MRQATFIYDTKVFKNGKEVSASTNRVTVPIPNGLGFADYIERVIRAYYDSLRVNGLTFFAKCDDTDYIKELGTGSSVVGHDLGNGTVITYAIGGVYIND